MNIDANIILQVTNLGVLIWVAKRQVERIDSVEKIVGAIKDRVTKIELTMKL